MDTICFRQKDEALGDDNQINTMVFGVAKKRVARYPDERPESQYDAYADTTMAYNINSRRMIPDNRYANISIMQQAEIGILSD
ncbi:MAG: hypothetical protein ACKPKO_36190, partial [Candidatus Fonsibacter sp.]